jgi:hypothetical protein
LSALIGSFFGIFLTFVFLNWILGRKVKWHPLTHWNA